MAEENKILIDTDNSLQAALIQIQKINNNANKKQMNLADLSIEQTSKQNLEELNIKIRFTGGK